MIEYYGDKYFIYKIEDGKIYQHIERYRIWCISSLFRSKKSLLTRKDIKPLTLLDLAMRGVPHDI